MEARRPQQTHGLDATRMLLTQKLALEEFVNHL